MTERPPTSSEPQAPERFPPQGYRWIAAAAFVLTTWFWWSNSYAPTHGDEIMAMTEMARGRLPYVDWYWHAPPGGLAAMFVVAKIFGVRLLPYLATGLAVRALAVAALHGMLAPGRSPTLVTLATAVAAILGTGDDAECLAGNGHMTTAFLVFATALVFPVLTEDRTSRVRPFLSGACLAVACLFTTSGACGALLVGLAIAAVAHYRASPRLRPITVGLGIAGGAAATLGLAAAVLASRGLLGPCLRSVFDVAPQAKGGIASALMRPLTGAVDSALLLWAMGVGVALVVTVAVAMRARAHVASRGQAEELFTTLGVVLFVLGAAFLGRSFATKGEISKPLAMVVVYVVTGGQAILALHRTLTLSRLGGASVDDARGALVGWLAVGAAYAIAVDATASEAMLFPAVAVALTEVHALTAEGPLRKSAAPAGLVVLLALVFVGSFRRHTIPYRWAFWGEPTSVNTAQVASRERELHGLLLAPNTAQIVDHVVDAIEAGSGPNDAVLAFPHLGALTAFADRRPFGFALSYWWDTCPDALARADAERVLRDPPPVFVVMDLPEAAVIEQEFLFRAGEKSGQRDLAAAIQTVIVRDRYRDAETFLTPGSRVALHVWVRPRIGEAAAPPPTPSGTP